MKVYGIGTALVIAAALLMILLLWLGVSPPVASGVGIAVAIVGFVMQMYSALSMKAASEKEFARAQQAHADLLERACKLPPEEAVALLLGGTNQRQGEVK